MTAINVTSKQLACTWRRGELGFRATSFICRRSPVIPLAPPASNKANSKSDGRADNRRANDDQRNPEAGICPATVVNMTKQIRNARRNRYAQKSPDCQPPIERAPPSGPFGPHGLGYLGFRCLGNHTVAVARALKISLAERAAAVRTENRSHDLASDKQTALCDKGFETAGCDTISSNHRLGNFAKIGLLLRPKTGTTTAS